jgi:hypothetical protein
MRARLVVLCLVGLAALLLYACASRQDVLVTKLRGRGTSHLYPVTVDQAWNISKAIFRLEPTDAIEEYRSENYMLTSENAGPLSAATYLGVFFEPAEAPGETRVTFVARRKTPTQSYPALTESSFHQKFAELVGLMATLGAHETVGRSAEGVSAAHETVGTPSDAGAPDHAAAPTSAGAARDAGGREGGAQGMLDAGGATVE